VLLDDLDHSLGADGAATVTDRKAEALSHGDRLNQRDRPPDKGDSERHDPLWAAQVDASTSLSEEGN
jgi:hypothetical protein